METYHITTFQKEIYYYLSIAYEGNKMSDNALNYYKKYIEIKEKVLSEEREKAFKILDLKYKVSQEKQKNAMQQVELLKKDKRLTLLFFLVTFVLLCAIFIFILYKRKMRRYREIVHTNLDKLENERRLRMQLEKTLQDNKEKPDTKYNTSSLSDEKGKKLFLQLEKLMRTQKIYHDSALTIDKLASLLKTNRTYLSQVINEQSKNSYSVYINNYRINEAVELLSDPHNDEQLKTISYNIGFYSPSTFYSLFKMKVGMSPSIYRDNVRKIS